MSDRSGLRMGTPAGRWVIAATVAGSGMAFLDGTVVNVALPSIAADLDIGLTGLQWTLDAYLVTLSALLLLGGALGDRYGRRRTFVAGLVGFTGASVLCGLAPNVACLVAARAAQGVGAAFLVPGSLAIISATFTPEDRSRAVGAWSGLGGVAGAVGPFLGGWLVDAASWRFVFLINVPVAAVTAWIALRHVPETRDEQGHGPPDLPGAVAVSVGLAGLAYACIEGASDFGIPEGIALAAGAAALVAFIRVERTHRNPMLPLSIFGSRQFSGANATTLAVYLGLGGATFLLVLQLQNVLGYSALEAGAALLPVTMLLIALSARAGALAQRIGPRVPMTVGPLVVAGGLALFARVEAGTSYAGSVLPAAVVFGSGLALTVAPLTSAVLGAVDERHLGAASGVNNAVARLAGLLAVAVLPVLAGVDGAGSPAEFSDAFGQAMLLASVICASGGLIAFLTIRGGAGVESITQASVHQPCHDPCVADVA